MGPSGPHTHASPGTGTFPHTACTPTAYHPWLTHSSWDLPSLTTLLPDILPYLPHALLPRLPSSPFLVPVPWTPYTSPTPTFFYLPLGVQVACVLPSLATVITFTFLLLPSLPTCHLCTICYLLCIWRLDGCSSVPTTLPSVLSLPYLLPCLGALCPTPLPMPFVPMPTLPLPGFLFASYLPLPVLVVPPLPTFSLVPHDHIPTPSLPLPCPDSCACPLAIVYSVSLPITPPPSSHPTTTCGLFPDPSMCMPFYSPWDLGDQRREEPPLPPRRGLPAACPTFPCISYAPAFCFCYGVTPVWPLPPMPHYLPACTLPMPFHAHPSLACPFIVPTSQLCLGGRGLFPCLPCLPCIYRLLVVPFLLLFSPFHPRDLERGTCLVCVYVPRGRDAPTSLASQPAQTCAFDSFWEPLPLPSLPLTCLLLYAIVSLLPLPALPVLLPKLHSLPPHPFPAVPNPWETLCLYLQKFPCAALPMCYCATTLPTCSALLQAYSPHPCHTSPFYLPICSMGWTSPAPYLPAHLVSLVPLPALACLPLPQGGWDPVALPTPPYLYLPQFAACLVPRLVRPLGLFLLYAPPSLPACLPLACLVPTPPSPRGVPLLLAPVH